MVTDAEKEVMENNLKIRFDVATFQGYFPYDEAIRVCDAIIALGYKCEIVNNGNFVFTRLKK